MQHQEILPGVYEVELGLGAELWQAALQELENCDVTHRDHYHDQDDLGAESLQVSGANCERILDFFHSEQWYDKLVSLCEKDSRWSVNWAKPTEQWFRHFTRFSYHWHRVPGNYHNHGWHVDRLRTVIHGMMYISPGYPTVESSQSSAAPRSLRQSLRERMDQTRLSTTLFRDTDKEIDIPITTGLDRGWIVLQTGQQLHRGINLGQMPRYTFKWVISLKLD